MLQCQENNWHRMDENDNSNIPPHTTVSPVRLQFFGEGERTLVLLHGAGSSSKSWDTVAKCLPPRLRLVTVDEPGPNAPAYKNEPYQLDTVGKLVAESLPAMDNMWIVGHSLGALLALEVACHIRDVPVGVVMVSPVLFEVESALASLREFVRRPAVGIGALTFVLAGAVPGPMLAGLLRLPGIGALGAKTMDISLNRETLTSLANHAGYPHYRPFAILRAARRVGLAALLERTPCRIAVLKGPNDRMTTAEDEVQLHRIRPEAVIRTVPEFGHMPAVEDPARFWSELLTTIDVVEGY